MVLTPSTTVVVSHEKLYGEDVSVALSAPSTQNSTRVTLLAGTHVALTATVPERGDAGTESVTFMSVLSAM
jgi:hypothetical protein